MRIVFAGTPDIARIGLEKLLTTSHEIVGVFTQPDRPAGRGRKLTPTPVKELALAHHLPVFQPIGFKKQPEALEALRTLSPDLMVVIAYGLLLPQSVLDIPKLGCWNVHVSLLPRWRGAAPIQRAIEAGDAQTGVCIMQMDAGLDTGDILLQATTSISSKDTAQTLHDRLAVLGANTLMIALEQREQEKLRGIPQSQEGVSYAHKLSKEEANVNWMSTASQLDCQIRAFNPWPVAYSFLEGERIRIWTAEVLPRQTTTALAGSIVAVSNDGIDVACHGGVLRLKQLQMAGGKVLPVAHLLQGQNNLFAVGKQFSQNMV